MYMSIFDHIHSKTSQITLSFPKFAPSMQKISSFYLFLIYSQF